MATAEFSKFAGILSGALSELQRLTNQKISINSGILLEKAEEPEIKLPTSVGSSKKPESSRKTSISALLTILKPMCGSQQTVENS